MKDELEIIPAPGTSLGNGSRPIWKLEKSGKFSSCSLWRKLDQRQHGEKDEGWSGIWRFKGPSNPSFSLWLAKHQRLLTMENLYKRYVVNSPNCVLCGAEVESILHTLRDCSRPRQTWLYLLPKQNTALLWNCKEVDDWLKVNLVDSCKPFSKYNGWHYIFREVIHAFWPYRNLELYDSIELCLPPFLLAKFLLENTFKLLYAWESKAYP